jgi:hypothetical protein
MTVINFSTARNQLKVNKYLKELYEDFLESFALKDTDQVRDYFIQEYSCSAKKRAYDDWFRHGAHDESDLQERIDTYKKDLPYRYKPYEKLLSDRETEIAKRGHFRRMAALGDPVAQLQVWFYDKESYLAYINPDLSQESEPVQIQETVYSLQTDEAKNLAARLQTLRAKRPLKPQRPVSQPESPPLHLYEKLFEVETQKLESAAYQKLHSEKAAQIDEMYRHLKKDS